MLCELLEQILHSNKLHPSKQRATCSKEAEAAISAAAGATGDQKAVVEVAEATKKLVGQVAIKSEQQRGKWHATNGADGSSSSTANQPNRSRKAATRVHVGDRKIKTGQNQQNSSSSGASSSSSSKKNLPSVVNWIPMIPLDREREMLGKLKRPSSQEQGPSLLPAAVLEAAVESRRTWHSRITGFRTAIRQFVLTWDGEVPGAVRIPSPAAGPSMPQVFQAPGATALGQAHAAAPPAAAPDVQQKMES